MRRILASNAWPSCVFHPRLRLPESEPQSRSKSPVRPYAEGMVIHGCTVHSHAQSHVFLRLLAGMLQRLLCVNFFSPKFSVISCFNFGGVLIPFTHLRRKYDHMSKAFKKFEKKVFFVGLLPVRCAFVTLHDGSEHRPCREGSEEHSLFNSSPIEAPLKSINSCVVQTGCCTNNMTAHTVVN
jgi:hypothetical protein